MSRSALCSSIPKKTTPFPSSCCRALAFNVRTLATRGYPRHGIDCCLEVSLYKATKEAKPKPQSIIWLWTLNVVHLSREAGAQAQGEITADSICATKFIHLLRSRKRLPTTRQGIIAKAKCLCRDRAFCSRWWWRQVAGLIVM